jgi:hypothetical protein
VLVLDLPLCSDDEIEEVTLVPGDVKLLPMVGKDVRIEGRAMQRDAGSAVVFRVDGVFIL